MKLDRIDASTRVGGEATSLPVGVVGLLTIVQAATYLRVSIRHLRDRADIPRLDVSAPGATRPQWRYRVADLDAFAASRTILPYRSDARRSRHL